MSDSACSSSLPVWTVHEDTKGGDDGAIVCFDTTDHVYVDCTKCQRPMSMRMQHTIGQMRRLELQCHKCGTGWFVWRRMLKRDYTADSKPACIKDVVLVSTPDVKWHWALGTVKSTAVMAVVHDQCGCMVDMEIETDDDGTQRYFAQCVQCDERFYRKCNSIAH